MRLSRLLGRTLVVATSLTLLGACGPGRNDTPTTEASPSAGQVKAVGSSKMSLYAAARAADQVSFGATPALVAELQQLGLEAWIDKQMSLTPSTVTSPQYVIQFDGNDPVAGNKANRFPADSIYTLSLSGPDQLRLRVNWALQQFIPVDSGTVRPYAAMEYFNMFQRNVFGNYRTFLRELSENAAMGRYLNNDQNRPRSTQCPSCSPNENWARELMQLFSIGVVQLNLDGSAKRDGSGRVLETYTQHDVEELARAVTGWRFATSNPAPPQFSDILFGLPMIPDERVFARDSGAKTVMGTSFPANQTVRQDLETAITMLMAHDNIAPFIALRLIQHLVTSNPTPQYLSRVAAVFRNNGQGTAGDLKATLKAVLLDPEARKGDLPGTDSARFGKLREPVLFITAALRGLGCTVWLKNNDGNQFNVRGQRPMQPPSVFSFYLPTDRAPGSNLLAPEQKLATTEELSARLRYLEWALVDTDINADAGCDVASLGLAFTQSPKALIDVISARWFRGAMPPTLRSNLTSLAASQTWTNPTQGAVQLLEFALTTPYFGVIK